MPLLPAHQRGRQEGSQKAHRTELNRKAEAIVVAAPGFHQVPVSVVEVEIASQLLGGGIFGVAPVGALLLRGQELYRHDLFTFPSAL